MKTFIAIRVHLVELVFSGGLARDTVQTYNTYSTQIHKQATIKSQYNENTNTSRIKIII